MSKYRVVDLVKELSLKMQTCMWITHLSKYRKVLSLVLFDNTFACEEKDLSKYRVVECFECLVNDR